MPKRFARRSIERRILTSILWVGVIPMAIALVLGYFVAHEGQRLAVQQKLETAASKTAQGVQLAVKGRGRGPKRLAQDSHIVEALTRLRASEPIDETALVQLLEEEAERSGDLESEYGLYNHEGRFVVGTTAFRVMDRYHPEWVTNIKETTFDSFKSAPSGEGYTARVVSPVRHPETGEIVGFVSDDQQVYDLLVFVLKQGALNSRDDGVTDVYEVVYITDLIAVTVYPESLADFDEEGGYPELHIEPSVDPKLAQRLRGAGPHGAASFSIWNYESRGQQIDALMAYHRLLPEESLFIVVYRPRSIVFANINLAAILSFAVSVLVIATFCIIAYRNVHNNIIRAVSLLNEGAQIIRQGDYELKLKIGTGDEIEQLASSFNEMASALHHNITQLEESEEKYRSLVTAMRDGICQTDGDGQVVFMNPAGLDILGFDSLDQIAGKRLHDAFESDDDYDRISEDIESQGFVDRNRVWMRRADGRRICVEITANRVDDDEGNYVGVEGTFRDVTQSVRLEQEARERSERIGAINQIANVINSSLEAGRVYESMVRELRKLIDFDYAAVTLRIDDGDGYETRRLWPDTPGMGDEVRYVATESCAAWVAREHRMLVVNDTAAQHPGTPVTFEPGMGSCVSVPLYANERIIGSLDLAATAKGAFSQHELEVVEQMAPHVAIAIRNASLLNNLQQSLDEVNRAREELHRVNEELKTLDEMKTNLLSNVSHELRTPLVAVMGYTDMIINEKAGPLNDMQKEYLNISLRNIEKLVTLIENLLDFSRLHRGQEELLFDTLDLVDCARTSIQIVQPVADSREIEVTLNTDADQILVEGDKGKLGQVFNNLLSNAVKFNKPGGAVNVHLRLSNGNVEVSVQDTGIGIPEEAQDKVFTRFYQYDGSSTRKYGGTGIGLAIAQDIMRLHGSRLMVNSIPDEGTTFYFTLPLCPQDRVEEPAQPRPDDRESDSGLPMPTETHLLVGLMTQDRSLSHQVRNMLFSEGMDVVHAAYPAYAVSMANKYNPDCLVVDTQAGPLGTVVLDEIIGNPSVPNIPIILLTNDDELYEKYKDRVAARVRRGFRRSTLLSGIHYALSQGVEPGVSLGRKILTVDDDPEICTFINRVLTPEGFEVDECASGEEALNLLSTGAYWLCLLDIAMPGLDGWKTLDKIRANPDLDGLKIYMVTAKPIEKTIQEVKECGADGYILKPFKPDDLIAIVQGFSGGHTNQ
ncbi:MAG: response regulator [Candidatus Hydrogenedentota bacterium]